MVKLVQFGAGNIGRSFIGQIFSSARWDLVFVDVNEGLVSLLNEKKYYHVAIKRDGCKDKIHRVGPVRALNGSNSSTVAAELAGADLVCTSVGKNALPKILPLVAAGLNERRRLYGDRPLDIILAENAREAPGLCGNILSKELGASYPLDTLAGIVEASIGKMVPIMKAEDLASDPLLLFAEKYETLIVDKRGFRGPIPNVANLCPVEPIEAYVDRKLFIHNLGHAAAAYLGYRALTQAGAGGTPHIAPSRATIPQVLALDGIESKARQAMNESSAALLKEYPSVFTAQDLFDHIENLLFRFKNRALGDTVYRVGRDLRRKLSRDDRLAGAVLLCEKHRLPCTAIMEAYRAALGFACPGEDGALYPPDAEFRAAYGLDGEIKPETVNRVLDEVSGIRPADDSSA
jgi:mannitol-1-phosphate 5-dehydrogenase